VKAPTPPERLVASDDDDVARLLRSLEDDAPPSGGQAALLARIDAVEAGDDGKPPVRDSKVSSWRSLALVGGLLVTAGLLATAAVRRDASAPPSSAAPRTTAIAPPSPAAATPEPVPAQTSSVAVDQLPQALSPQAAPSPISSSNSNPSSNPIPHSVSGASASAEDKDSFREQLALVESARHSLSQGKANDCLATLRRYDTKYPTGLFTAEVQVVRVEALMAAGQSDKAYDLARRLVSEAPHGPYADRLRALLSKTEGLEQ
jgi:hypothetical protein